MNSLKNLELYEAYCHIVATCPSRVETILKLVKIMLTLSASTAQYERVFSQMKILKGRLRCKLTQANLQAQLFIMMEGPSLKSFSRQMHSFLVRWPQKTCLWPQNDNE